jgi:hypothetical protein
VILVLALGRAAFPRHALVGHRDSCLGGGFRWAFAYGEMHGLGSWRKGD